MILKNNIRLIIAISVFLVSCENTTVVDAVNYIKYIDNTENGLVQEYANEEKALKLKAQYKTPEYLAIKEIGVEAFHPDSIVTLAKEFDGGYHFNFTISSSVSGYDVIKEKLSPSDYLKRITYLTGEIRKDFKLVSGLDTLPCVVCHYERNYNISPNNVFILVFPYQQKTESDLTLLYDDKLFNQGIVEFKFKNKNIKNTPKLL